MKRTIYITFWILLLLPLFGVIYSEFLHLPKSIDQVYTYYAFAIGFGYLFFYRQYLKVPLYVLNLFFFGIINLYWELSLNVDKHILTIIYYSILPFAIFSLIIIILNTNFSEKFVKRSISIVKGFVIVGALISIIQVYDYSFLNPYKYFANNQLADIAGIYEVRRQSIFGVVGPQNLALGFMPLFALLISHMLFNRERFVFLFLILGGIIALLTNSRSVIGSYFIVCLLLFVYSKSIQKFAIYMLFILMVGIVLFNILSALDYDLTDWYSTRLFAEGSIDRTTRYNAFKTFSIVFPNAPLFGVGSQNESIVYLSRIIASSSHIHVGYLSHLVNYGLIGCIFLFGFWFGLARNLYKEAKKTQYWGSFFAYLVFFWTFATMSQSSILYSGLIFAVIYHKYYYDYFHCKNRNIVSS